MSMLSISLFAGAGGMDLGFEEAGFEIRCGVELLSHCCSTLKANRPSMAVIGPPSDSGDAFETTTETILDRARMTEGEAAVIIGGPPCQPFSIAANQRFLKGDVKFKRTGFNDIKKGRLLDEYVRIVREARPYSFVLENVPGLAEIDGGEELRRAVRLLEDSGYRVDAPHIVNAAWYGIPQKRQRLFLIGVRDRGSAEIGFPKPTHGPGFIPFRTVAEALVHLDLNALNHMPREHKPESIQRYRTLRFGQREQLGRVDRLDPRLPSKTVIAGGTAGGGRSHLHPYLARTLTVRECARLQTFKDTYAFCGPVARQFTQVGNAVPPLLAEHVARHLRRVVFGQSVPKSCNLGNYLHHSSSLETLCEILKNDSLRECPELGYDDAIHMERLLVPA